MFSRDDFDRGSRFPLAGVVIPFVVGALIIAGITVGLRAAQGFPDIELAEEIRQASLGESLLLADAIDLEWDHVCVFPPYMPQEAVDAKLDFEWGRSAGHSTDGYLLLVFVQDREVVSHAYVERGILVDPDPDGDCRTPDDARTRLNGPSVS